MYNDPCLLRYVYVPYRLSNVNFTCTMGSANCTKFTGMYCKLQTEENTLYTTHMWRKVQTVHLPLNTVHCKMYKDTVLCT